MESWITPACAAVVLIGATFTLWSKIREARENRRGWRTNIDVLGIRYAEKTQDGVWNSLLIRCSFRGHRFLEAHVPAAEAWNARHPIWAHDRREEIIARVRSEAPALPFVEEPIQPPQPAGQANSQQSPSRVT